jgi:hypothetical protein
MLEGGYDLPALSSCVATCVNLLVGGDEVVDEAGPAPKRNWRINTDALIAELRRIHHLTGYRMNRVPKETKALLRAEMKGPSPAAQADQGEEKEGTG